jgi:uncharacterized protein (TIGR02145 family)
MKTAINFSLIILLVSVFYSCKKDSPVIPTLSTSSISGITTTSAISGGNITSNGGSQIVSEGICWSITDNPTTADNKTTDNGSSSLFNGTMTGLSPNTTYFVRAWATNGVGTSYGQSVSFTTLGDSPVINVLEVSDLNTTSATLNGTINPNYLSTTYQILWGTSTDYGNTLVPEQNSLDGGANVNIIDGVSGLVPGTTYHYIIEATNELGKTQSLDNSFRTLGDLPSITAPVLSELTTSSVVIATQVNPNYLASAVVAEYGLNVSYDNTLETGQDSLKGSTASEVVMHVEGLMPGTDYHIRIKATNELGDSFSEDITFTTYTVMDYDGNYYYSVKVNDQEWLKENLRNTHFQNGDVIPEVSDATAWTQTTDPAYCQYKNDPAVSAVYGYLYNFFVAGDSRNVCPVGWHVPTLDEWHTLITYLGGDELGDKKIREAGTTHWFTDTGATNETGMTVLPAGNRELNGDFVNKGSSAHLWSSFEGTVGYETGAWNIGVDNGVSRVFWTPYSNKFGASIRCLKDVVAK